MQVTYKENQTQQYIEQLKRKPKTKIETVETRKERTKLKLGQQKTNQTLSVTDHEGKQLQNKTGLSQRLFQDALVSVTGRILEPLTKKVQAEGNSRKWTNNPTTGLPPWLYPQPSRTHTEHVSLVQPILHQTDWQ